MRSQIAILCMQYLYFSFNELTMSSALSHLLLADLLVFCDDMSYFIGIRL